MVDEKIEEAKAALRIKAHAARAALPQADRADAALAVMQHFFEGITLRAGDVVAAYWRIRDELDCQPILVRLMDSNQTVVLPVVLGPDEPLDLRVWEQGASLYEAGFGTLATRFTDRTIVTYDPRGVERSERTDPDLEVFDLGDLPLRAPTDDCDGEADDRVRPTCG